MIVARTTLVATSGSLAQVTAQMVCDLLWLHSHPSARVEHIRVRAGPEGYEVVWFMLGGSAENARMRALEICRDTIANTGALTNWKVH